MNPRHLLSDLWHDLRMTPRLLWRSPGLTVLAVVTLAVGIGANTAIFSVLDAVLLNPLPYTEPDRVLLVRERSVEGQEMSLSWLNFLDWRERNRSLEGIAAFRMSSANLTGQGEPERLRAREVTPGSFAVLGVPPLLGRDLRPEEDAPDVAPVALLAEGLWQRRFEGSADVLGSVISLNDAPHTVIGVVPDRLARFQQTDVYVSLGKGAPMMQNRGSHPGIAAVARMRPGTTVDQARADLDAIAAGLEAEYPETNRGVRASVDTAGNRLFQGVRTPLWVLCGAVGVLLAIACGNVASLFLARATGRAREMAVRAALGAGRGRLVRQLLTESVLVALLGGGLGLLLAVWGVGVLTGLGQASLPRIDEVSLDGRVLVFTLVVAVLTGLAFGLAPAVRASRTSLLTALHESSPTVGGGRGRLLGTLVAAQVALSAILLVGGGLLVRSLIHLSRIDPGFDPRGVLTLSLSVPRAKYPTVESWIGLHQAVLERTRTIPGMVSAAIATSIPLGGRGSESALLIEGQPLDGERPHGQCQFVTVSPDYFRSLAIPLQRGRDFTAADDAAAPRVAIIDETLAERHFPDVDPVGRRIAFEGRPDAPGWRTVVGVVRHARQYGLEGQTLPQVYVPLGQLAEWSINRRPDMALFVRASTPPAGLADAVRAAIWEVDKNQPVYLVQTLERFVDEQVAGNRFSASLLGVFAGIGLLLAAVGLYGLVSFSVSRRTRELGLRVAMGARGADILRLVMGQGARLLGIGLPAGLLGALALSRTLADMLSGVPPADPLTFAAVGLLLAAVLLLACWIPARRAARLDPMVALRRD